MTESQWPQHPVAHSPNSLGRWHDLREHLEGVSIRARRFAEKLGLSEWAALAGLWHDLGKYHPDFQGMLHDAALGRTTQRVDHSTIGAIHASRRLAPAFASNPRMRQVEFLTLLLTAPIAGHHAGLPEGRDALQERLVKQAERYDLAKALIPPELLSPVANLPPLPLQLRARQDPDLAVELLVRFILSALVDADRLDTKAFAEEGQVGTDQAAREDDHAVIGLLRAALDDAVDARVRSLPVESMAPIEKEVNKYRQAVLAACRTAANEPPGAFALDVATGGGKTLASLSFALRHAESHGKDRVIVVIPFTSIVEQTALEYRSALGALEGNVLEHHSAVTEEPGPEPGWGPQDRQSLQRRLATENWDAPIIVTTAVQFFESLHSARPSRCRKLHNIANSVVVIDEAQTLPPGLLNPTVWLINELVERYGTTVVLSTATQPALEPPFPEVRNLKKIVTSSIPRPAPRVRVEIMGDGEMKWPELAMELASHASALCITHQRADAREVTNEVDRVLGHQETLHLSAAMCAAHRSLLIAEVKRRLRASLPCRVIATQLVEAGVDLDFPVVYRALAGVDSMVQAAGRANREGRLGVRGGLLKVFRAPTKPPRGLLRLAADAADGLVRAAQVEGRTLDLFDSGVARSYFRRFYGRIDDRDSGVSNLRREFRFRSVEDAYRFVDDAGLNVIVPYGDATDIVRRLRPEGTTARSLLRRVQGYAVSVFPRQIETLQQLGAIEPLVPSEGPDATRTFVLKATHSSFYDSRFGLVPEGQVPSSGYYNA